MKSNTICKKLENSIFNALFKQLDLIIINWGDPIKYSLHIASAVRVCYNDKIILNVSDEFFTKDGKPKGKEEYDHLESLGIINDPDSLLANNITVVNELLKGKTVNKVKVSKWNDLFISFSNGIEIQIIQDCLEQEFEYYRFIEFLPYYDENYNNYKSVHYVVKNMQGVPTLEREK